MGRAVVLSNAGDGRYTIEIDLGTGVLAEKVAQITAQIALLNTRINTAILSVAAAQSVADSSRAALEALINALGSGTEVPVPGSPQGKEHEQALRVSMIAMASLARKQSALAALQLQRTQQQRRLTSLQDLPLIQTRSAWCVDFTESASGAVATLEVPGESDLILIAPGGPPWSGADGVLAARELLDPNQSFFNVAILPGWQKYKPTFRRGTLIGINKELNTGSVALADHRSSAQRLPVDQQSVLTNIPVTYMTCHAAVFDVGDQVVVMFDDQDQAQPRVIGFVTDPKPCAQYTLTYVFQMKYSAPSPDVQLVYEGQDGDEVTAPSPSGVNGWLGWSDGNTDFSRLDENITSDATYIARYTQFADVVGESSTFQLYIVSSVFVPETGLYTVTFGLTVTFSFSTTSLEGPSSGLLQVMPDSVVFDDTTPRVEFLSSIPSSIPPNFLYSGVVTLISAAIPGNTSQTTSINGIGATVTFTRLSESAGFDGSTSLWRAILVSPQTFV